MISDTAITIPINVIISHGIMTPAHKSIPPNISGANVGYTIRCLPIFKNLLYYLHFQHNQEKCNM